MKLLRISGALLILVLVLTACGEQGYVIHAHFTGDVNGKKVYLLSDGEDKVLIDSQLIYNNHVIFTGAVANPGLHSLKIIKEPIPEEKSKRKPHQPIIPFFLENAEIEINAELDSIPTELALLTRDYSYKNISFEGSLSNELYLTFFEEKKKMEDKRYEIFDEYIDYLNPEEGEEKGKISTGIEIVSRMDLASEKRNAFVSQFIKENKDNFIGLYAAYSSLGNFNTNEIDELQSVLGSGGLMETEAGQSFMKKAKDTKISAEGSMFYDLDMKDHLGNPHKLSEYLGKGKYVLIDFWASWCGPCKADLPHLKEAFELYHPSGFEVVSVSLDDDKEAWLKEIENYELTWPQLSDLKAFDGPVSKKYSFRGIPTCILFGPDGKIVDRNMRGSWMDMILIDLYGNKFGDKY